MSFVVDGATLHPCAFHQEQERGQYLIVIVQTDAESSGRLLINMAERCLPGGEEAFCETTQDLPRLGGSGEGQQKRRRNRGW